MNMPKKNNHSKAYSQIKEYAIYVIVDAATHTFYVGNTTQERLKKEYSDHYNGKKKYTKELYDRGIKNSQLPKMYYLTDVRTDKYKANSYMIPYIKFFLEQGMHSLNSQTLIEATKNLTDENQSVYLYLKEYSYSDLCNENQELSPGYIENKEKKDKKTPSGITIKVSEDEYFRIASQAKKYELTIASYVRQMAKYNAQIINIDFEKMNESLSVIYEVEETLRKILYTIHKTENYYADDLVLLQKIIDEVHLARKDMVHCINDTMKDLNKLLN